MTARYDRNTDIPRHFGGIWPDELAETIEARRSLVARMERMLRTERQRGLDRHWNYDLPRHVAMLRIYRQEKDDLEVLLKAALEELKAVT